MVPCFRVPGEVLNVINCVVQVHTALTARVIMKLLVLFVLATMAFANKGTLRMKQTYSKQFNADEESGLAAYCRENAQSALCTLGAHFDQAAEELDILLSGKEPVHKRKSAFVRFGKRSDEVAKRKSAFVRFGKRKSSYVRFG